MKLTTERLSIRPFLARDKDDVYEIYSDERVCHYLLEDPWSEATKEAAFHKKLEASTLTEDSPLSLAVLLDEKVIGDISVWYTGMKQTVEIGFVFNPKFSKKGYAKESVSAVIRELFTRYDMHRIQANLDARNTASAQLCRNLGMRQEAHFIKDFWNKGEWTDSYVFGLLKEDI